MFLVVDSVLYLINIKNEIEWLQITMTNIETEIEWVQSPQVVSITVVFGHRYPTNINNWIE